MEAKDGGVPARSSTAVITIEVERNFETPAFTSASYSTQISETQALSISVLRVSAFDSDVRVSRYILTIFDL